MEMLLLVCINSDSFCVYYHILIIIVPHVSLVFQIQWMRKSQGRHIYVPICLGDNPGQQCETLAAGVEIHSLEFAANCIVPLCVVVSRGHTWPQRLLLSKNQKQLPLRPATF